MFKYLLAKEFKQMFRNSFIPRMIIVYPCMMMLLIPWAVSHEIKNLNLVVVDNDNSPMSRRLIEKASSSTYFEMKGMCDTYNDAISSIESSEADVILEIPRYFEKSIKNGDEARVLIAANTVNGTKGEMGSAYLASIVSVFAGETNAEHPKVAQHTAAKVPSIGVTTLNLYNPHLNYKLFMVPALVVIMLTLLCGFLPALNVVSEKESGTIEQINVTPVNKLLFILAKLVPYWVVGFFVLTVCFILAYVVYGIVPQGNIGIIYLFSYLFVIAISGLGLVISNFSATLQQAMFVMWFFLLIFILMSGLLTPIDSMPHWAQVITMFNPLRYLMQVMRMVYLKSSGFVDLLPQFGALLAFAVFFNVLAVCSYTKKN